MLTAVYYNNNDVRIEERTTPTISTHEILVKVQACGICGSDVLEWYRIQKAPRVLGHEMTGEITGVGKDIDTLKIGDRVFVSHHVPCNECRYCLGGYHTACETLHTTNFDPGGFSEFVRIPNINVRLGTFLLPYNITYDEGTFIEPLGCVIRGQRLVEIQPEHTVLILGSGVTGLLHIQLAKRTGAQKVIATDINAYRINAATQFGADIAVHAREDIPTLLRTNNGRLADRVIVCTGALSAVEQAIHSIDRGGTILFFAVPKPSERVIIPFSDLWRNEVTLKTSYGASPSDLSEALEIISSRTINVRDMITHRFSLTDIHKGFQIVAEARESLKVIITPTA